MGNHAVGRAFVALALAIAERRKDGETAVEILDQAADQSEVRGMDAEFDDATMLGEPFADLIIEAFGGGSTFGVDDEDDGEAAYDAFYEGPYSQFRERYELC